MRYAVAAIFSLLILAGGAGWYRHLKESIKDGFRVDFQRAKDAGELPPEMQNLDFETVWKRGFGGEVSSSTMTKIHITQALRGFWYVWAILVVVVVSFGVAHWMSPKAPQQESQQ